MSKRDELFESMKSVRGEAKTKELFNNCKIVEVKDNKNIIVELSEQAIRHISIMTVICCKAGIAPREAADMLNTISGVLLAALIDNEEGDDSNDNNNGDTSKL